MYETVLHTDTDCEPESDKDTVVQAEEHAECVPVVLPLKEPDNVPDRDEVPL